MSSPFRLKLTDNAQTGEVPCHSEWMVGLIRKQSGLDTVRARISNEKS